MDFAPTVPSGGYAWWYVDALSDDGRFGLTVIAFIGSVFSPYYGWSRARDPLDHCAINVALYGPRSNRWAMTERGRGAVVRSTQSLRIGPSALRWDGQALSIDIDEVTVPFPARIRGTIRVVPRTIQPTSFALDAAHRHHWRPIAPAARVTCRFTQPGVAWEGDGYLDMNAGAEPLADGFSRWTWSRTKQRDATTILYDCTRRDGSDQSLALHFDADGGCRAFDPPMIAPLPATRWRIKRETRSDDGRAHVLQTFEDTPFYARSLIAATLEGETAIGVHESLSLDRFANPIVKAMLPFRMPRRP